MEQRGDYLGWGLFHALGTLGTFDASAEGKDVLGVGYGFQRCVAATFQGEGHETLHQLVERYARSFPQVERERSGDGVDFVDIDFARVAVDDHVDAAYAVT